MSRRERTRAPTQPGASSLPSGALILAVATQVTGPPSWESGSLAADYTILHLSLNKVTLERVDWERACFHPPNPRAKDGDGDMEGTTVRSGEDIGVMEEDMLGDSSIAQVGDCSIAQVLYLKHI